MNSVVVVDYGMGNLLSVERALSHCGAHVTISADPDIIEGSSHLILPGVGAFARAMVELRRRELVEPLRAFAGSGRPFLGICLGMQLLMDSSLEFGNHQGLGLIEGRVEPIPTMGPGERAHKVPHIGWNKLEFRKNEGWGLVKTDRTTVEPQPYVYFVHSFRVQPKKDDFVLAETHYNGVPIVAMIQRQNILGCQFHPEKSGAVGLAILRSFCDLQAGGMTESEEKNLLN